VGVAAKFVKSLLILAGFCEENPFSELLTKGERVVIRNTLPALVLSAIVSSLFVWHGSAARLPLVGRLAHPFFSGASMGPTKVDPDEVGERNPVKVERLDPMLDRIVPANTALFRVATAYKFTEGPVWIPSRFLLFADIPNDNIDELDPDGKTHVFLHPNWYNATTPYEYGINGMTIDLRGRLTVAGYAQHDVWRLESMGPNSQVTILADSYDGKRLNAPNDLVYKSDGSLYFTDPIFGLRRQDIQLQVRGVYHIRGAMDQEPGAPPMRQRLQLLVNDLTGPNGIAFSPNEEYLYVNNSSPKKFWMRYRVKADPTLVDGKVFCDATSDPRRGNPDGMKVDTKGNIYSAGPGGVWIFSPKGNHLGTLEIPETVGNVAWGGSNHRTLYITATRSVYSIVLNAPGISPVTR
jgi:gluconolactonase